MEKKTTELHNVNFKKEPNSTRCASLSIGLILQIKYYIPIRKLDE